MHAFKRRRTTIRNTLFAGVAVIALSAAVPNAPKAQDYTFYGFVEGRYLMSFGDPTDVGFGQVACPLCTTVDTTESETDDGVGGKVKIGYRTSGAWDVAIAGSGGRLDGDKEPATASYYLSSTTYADAEGDAESETQYAIADFELGYNVGIGTNGGNIRLFAGARYVYFDQDVNFAGGFFAVRTGDLDLRASREVEFHGVGPRLGLGANLPLGQSFSIAAEVSGSVMFGERDTADSFATIEGAYSYSVSDSEDEIIPNAEGNVGLSFVVVGSNPGPVVEITLGYHAEAWFDINNTELDMFVPGTGLGVIEEDGNQYIHGPFVRIGMRR